MKNDTTATSAISEPSLPKPRKARSSKVNSLIDTLKNRIADLDSRIHYLNAERNGLQRALAALTSSLSGV